MHKCPDDKIKCFDCRKVICQECMVVDVNSVRCASCVDKGSKAPKSKKPASKVPPNVALVLSAMVYSFVIAKFFNLAGIC